MRYEDIERSFAAMPNYRLMPVYQCSTKEEFNELMADIKSLPEMQNARITRTKSGGISLCRKLFDTMPCYQVGQTSTGVEIVILSYEYGHARIQYRLRATSIQLSKVQGRQAFNKFQKDCETMGIDLHYHWVPEDVGWEIKQTIEKPYIDVLSPSFLDREIDNVHHLDINSSYPAGLAESHPEFRPLIQKYYESRKVNRDYKAILNLTIGFMQSKYCDYAYSALSRDAIEVNNTKVRQMTEWLMDQGRIVLLRNTDGIWFKGESLADLFDSTDLGDWHQDHTNCKIRIKSAGAYEFIDGDGQYYPVLRGATTLDKIKDRDQWKWGDIYHEAAEDVLQYKVSADGFLEEV